MNTGTTATRSAAIPDGTRCSAQLTAPLPPSSNRAPLINPTRHSTRFGHAAPSRKRAHNSTISPARTNRALAISSGGSVCTAKRMARYVEPQMTYTAAKAAIRRARIDLK